MKETTRERARAALARRRRTDFLRTFRGLVLDADGVFFDGKETRHQAGTISKTRDYRDGQGISFLRAMGIRILFATGEGEPLGSIVEKMNGLPSCVREDWWQVQCVDKLKQGKSEAVRLWCAGWVDRWDGEVYGGGFPCPGELSDLVYIGDDRTDCEAMKAVRDAGGLVAIPSDAQRVVRKYAGLVLTKPGGGGAIREFAEMVCDARGINEEGLATS